MSHPKEIESIGIHLEGFDEEELKREIAMMLSERTPNELVEDELEIIDDLAKRGEHK